MSSAVASLTGVASQIGTKLGQDSKCSASSAWTSRPHRGQNHTYDDRYREYPDEHEWLPPRCKESRHGDGSGRGGRSGRPSHLLIEASIPLLLPSLTAASPGASGRRKHGGQEYRTAGILTLPQ
jgi:hypothetical protein